MRGDAELERVFNVSEFEELARVRMDPGAFDYIAGGAWDEITLADNDAAFRRYRLRPRVLTGTEQVDTSTSLLGTHVSMPLGLAPTAMHRLAHPEGEVATAAAAAEAGVVMCLSTWSNCSMEEVAAAGDLLWMQLYVHKDRSRAEDIVARAAEAGFRALVVTVDLGTPGYRERDFRNRFSPPPEFGNLGEVPPGEMQNMVAHAHDRALSWADLEWLAGLSELPVVLKGILAAEDAVLAAEHGARAIWVSNHGGRQLDRTLPAIEALPEVVDAAGDRCEIYVDGGVRRGLDVVTALALGARAAFIGRPHLYALAAAGRDGVAHCLRLLAGELDMAMTLLGVAKVDEIGPRHLTVRP